MDGGMKCYGFHQEVLISMILKEKWMIFKREFQLLFLYIRSVHYQLLDMINNVFIINLLIEYTLNFIEFMIM